MTKKVSSTSMKRLGGPFVLIIPQYCMSVNFVYFVCFAIIAQPLQDTFDAPFTPGGFVRSSAKKHRKETVSSGPSQHEEHMRDGLFQCSNEGCVKVYQTNAALENHLQFGTCDLREENATLMDRAKKLYHHKLIEGTSSTTPVEENKERQAAKDPLTKGWALKSARTSKRFNEFQRSYLDGKFAIGQETGHKIDAAAVAKEMRYAKKKDGTRMIEAEEFLTETQIRGYFSRRAAKLRHGYEPDSDDEAAAEEETNYSTTRNLLVQDLGIQHPVTYHQYNLCEMSCGNKLSKLSIKLLQDICASMDIDTGNITTRRKAPYIALLSEAIQQCSCKK
jgi:hypothetical protein